MVAYVVSNASTQIQIPSYETLSIFIKFPVKFLLETTHNGGMFHTNEFIECQKMLHEVFQNLFSRNTSFLKYAVYIFSKCNECNCKKGKIVCKEKKCGDPISKGCWTMYGSNCVFRSPCPADHVDCTETIQEDMLSEENGCWAQVSGYCEFFFPCDNLS